METPNQDIPSKERIDENEALQILIKLLKEEAKIFRSLDIEATEAITNKQDAKTYKEKLNEKAQLIIDLPEKLKNNLVNINSQLRQAIENWVETIAIEAQKRLNDGRAYGLEMLLIHDGSGNKNDLEELIENLEKEL